MNGILLVLRLTNYAESIIKTYVHIYYKIQMKLTVNVVSCDFIIFSCVSTIQSIRQRVDECVRAGARMKIKNCRQIEVK